MNIRSEKVPGCESSKLDLDSLAKNLAKASEEFYENNQYYLGIVVVFNAGNETFHQQTYYNGENKYWFVNIGVILII